MSKGRGYTVLIKRSAEKEMDRLPARTFARAVQAILKLERDPRPKGSKKLRGVQDYRLRVGEYRVLYSVDDQKRVVEVIAVGHRREVYRRY
ncbi:MAG: type II toxin-antitoxin system RelE/ParE family toxin [Planctomycetes bacterium]|nr:type II toxin-antitoxin system RelE/ParE family toxin [Planctomycetota bacterium]